MTSKWSHSKGNTPSTSGSVPPQPWSNVSIFALDDDLKETLGPDDERFEDDDVQPQM